MVEEKVPFYQSRFGVLCLATLTCFLWGSAYPGVKMGYAMFAITSGEVASQMLFAGYRFAGAGLLLLVAGVVLRRPVFRFDMRVFGQMCLLGLTQTTLEYVFFYVGMAHAAGAKSSILSSTGVFFSVLIAHWLYDNDRLTSRRVVGCLAGFAGVMLVNFGGGVGPSLDFAFTLKGEGFIVAAALVLSGASIYGKNISRELDSLVVTGWQMLVGGAVLVGIGIVGGGHLAAMTPTSAALMLYLMALSSVAFACWTLLLKTNPVGRVVSHYFLVPVFGVVLSGLFLGENLLHWVYPVALVLVSLGVWLVSASGDVRQREPDAVPQAA